MFTPNRTERKKKFSEKPYQYTTILSREVDKCKQIALNAAISLIKCQFAHL